MFFSSKMLYCQFGYTEYYMMPGLARLFGSWYHRMYLFWFFSLSGLISYLLSTLILTKVEYESYAIDSSFEISFQQNLPAYIKYFICVC